MIQNEDAQALKLSVSELLKSVCGVLHFSAYNNIFLLTRASCQVTELWKGDIFLLERGKYSRGGGHYSPMSWG